MTSHPTRLLTTVAIALALPLVCVPARAQTQAPSAGAQTAAPTLTDGEVRKVDMEGGKVTLKHSEIKNLDMPGMTMVFAVKDKAMLDKLKTGDKVKFKAINDGGKITVTEIQAAQ
jgi:Cu/Ag efflux protein CusF